MREVSGTVVGAGVAEGTDTSTSRFSDDAERHYVFFHTIVFDEDEWPAPDPSVAERAA